MKPNDLLAISREELSELINEFGFDEGSIELDFWYCKVTFTNPTTLLIVVWEFRDQELNIELCKRNDEQCNRSANCYSTGRDYVYADNTSVIRAPELAEPPREFGQPLIESEARAILRRYSKTIRAIASDVLTGDFTVFDEIDEYIRIPLHLQHVEPRVKLGENAYEEILQRYDVKRGDVFVLQTTSDRYIFGRVVAIDAEVLDHKGLVLIYIYDATSSDMSDIPTLRRDALLIPPAITTRNLWGGDYFRTVANLPIQDDDVLPSHCFRDSAGGYHDEHNNILPCSIDSCGIYGVISQKQLDHMVSSALGLDVSPKPREPLITNFWQLLRSLISWK